MLFVCLYFLLTDASRWRKMRNGIGNMAGPWAKGGMCVSSLRRSSRVAGGVPIPRGDLEICRRPFQRASKTRFRPYVNTDIVVVVVIIIIIFIIINIIVIIINIIVIIITIGTAIVVLVFSKSSAPSCLEDLWDLSWCRVRLPVSGDETHKTNSSSSPSS